MAQGIRFCHAFFGVAQVNLSQITHNHSRMAVCCLTRNVQKSVTQIIYLGPLPSLHHVLETDLFIGAKLAAKAVVFNPHIQYFPSPLSLQMP